MTQYQYTEIAKEKLSKLDIKGLKEVVKECGENFTQAHDIINQIAIDLLSNLMTEEEFISFCEEY